MIGQNEKKWGAMMAALLVLSAIFYFMGVHKKQQQVQKLQAEIAVKEKEYIKLCNMSTPAAVAQQNRQLENARQNHEQLIARGERTSNFPYWVSDMANQLQIEQFVAKRLEKEADIVSRKNKYTQSQQIMVSFRTNYQNLVNFINQLERNNPAVFTDEMKVERNDQFPQYLKVEARLTMNAAQE